MSDVVPDGESGTMVSVRSTSIQKKWFAFCGLLYLLVTASGSILYLVILSPSISNDLWWPQFNATGAQTFLADLYNAKLALDVHGAFNIFDASNAIAKDYSHIPSLIQMRPSSARRIMLDVLKLDDAVRIIRSIDFYEIMRTLPPPCWLDFNRMYEMAHTARHQELCNSRRTMNAAMYLETILRNLQPNDLLSSTYYGQMQTGIFDAVELDPHSTKWVQTVKNPVWLSVGDEVMHWQSFGLTIFKNQLQNLFQEGIEESIVIVNALGMHQKITINSIPYRNRPKSTWTTGYSTCGFWNDIDAVASYESSLIRSAPNAFETTGNDWDIYYCGETGTPATALIRSHLGPLTVIDIILIPLPQRLPTLASEFISHLNVIILESTIPLPFVSSTIDPTPSSWIAPGAVYYGGNPMCTYGNPMPFIQPSFGYYDDCGVQEQHLLQLNRDSVLFAMFASSVVRTDLKSICQMCSSATSGMCEESLISAYEIFITHFPQLRLRLATLLSEATRDIQALNISFIQWGTLNASHQVLFQAMIDPHDLWSFYGWITMFEWVDEQREVYMFEGGYGTYTLMSRRHSYQPLAANSLELPKTACVYLWLVCLYVSAVLVCVISLLIIYGCLARFRFDGQNLFQVNRLIGGAWIGRPFLFLRGMTAVLVLSTSPISFTSRGGLSKLKFEPRPSWHSLILAGEVTWITYVINDVCLPFTQTDASVYAPISSILTWMIVFVHETFVPYEASATIHRTCQMIAFTHGLECTSGQINVGSLEHVAMHCIICILVAVLSYFVVIGWRATQLHASTGSNKPSSVLLSSTSDAYLKPLNIDAHLYDALACVMSGILPFGKYLFDIKIWVIFKANEARKMVYHLPPAIFTIQTISADELARRKSSLRIPAKLLSSKHSRLVGLLGLLYMIGAVALSFVFLGMSRSLLANDFMWAGFNDTDTQSFLCNWFNMNLQIINQSFSFQINHASMGVYSSTSNKTHTGVLSSALYAIAIQDEANTLPTVIQGLRNMDGCLVPWISTVYCYVDVDRTWEMAHSSARQTRCLEQKSNGAIYLETILRNCDRLSFNACWGAAIEMAVLSYLRTTNNGNTWLKSIDGIRLVVPDEVLWWQAHGISHFTTQWQNFKSLGVSESFVVRNALGVDFPLTLKKTNSSFQLSAATSLKMFWPLAKDLTLIVSNTSVASHQSLVRQSPLYVYSNRSIGDVLNEQSIVLAPLGPALSIFQSVVGPFGVVDIKRIAVPAELREYYLATERYITTELATNELLQSEFWPHYIMHVLTPQPSSWIDIDHWGGDLNCGLNYGGSALWSFQYFSSSGVCANYLTDYLTVTTRNVLKAILTSDLYYHNDTMLSRVASCEFSRQSTTIDLLNASATLILKHFPWIDIKMFMSTSDVVRVRIRDEYQLKLVQYLSMDGVNYELSQMVFFSPSEVSFEFYYWLYLFEWVEGKREVVSFIGDIGNITTLSTVSNYMEQPVNSLEIPLNVSTYFLALIQYITILLLCVGCIVCVYIVSSRGYIEGKNMMSFTLVAGHVWIGRPLMLLRSLVAICFLSTSKLLLVRPFDGLVTHFDSPTRYWVLTLLSSGEMAWLVNVIHDTFSLVTREYTSACFTNSVFTVCVSAAIWSFVSPTQHSVSLSRSCQVVTVDFDVVCMSGKVAIGDFDRFCGLIFLGFGGCILSYLIERYRRGNTNPPIHWMSFFLYSAAKHKFERPIHANWEYCGILYLDKASATLTGVLSLEYKHALYILDIKTWRVYYISSEQLAQRGYLLPPHIQLAIPLVE